MKLFLAYTLIALSFSADSLGQDKLKYSSLREVHSDSDMKYDDEPTDVFFMPDGTCKTVSFTDKGGASIIIQTFSSEGTEINRDEFELDKAPFNNQNYFGAYWVDGAIALITTDEWHMIEKETDGGLWNFWRLNGSEVEFIKEIDLQNTYHRRATKVHQSRNKEYFLLEIDKGEGFVLLNKNFEIEGDYDLIEEDNSYDTRHITLDNVIVDDFGNIGFSIVMLIKTKVAWFSNISKAEGTWMAGTINNKTKQIGSFDLGAIVEQKNYYASGSTFIDQNDTEFVLMNFGRDLVRIKKQDGTLLDYERIDVYKYIAKPDKESIFGDRSLSKVSAKIDENSFCYLFHGANPNTCQLFIVKTDGTVVKTSHVLVPLDLSSVDGLESYKSKPFLFAGENTIEVFMRLSANEAEAIKTQNFNDKKLKYGKDREIYRVTFDFNGNQLNFEKVNQPVSLSYEYVTLRETNDMKGLKISYGKGKKLELVVTQLDK